MKVSFLRHCESIYNKYLTSSKNCELTDEGKNHASTLKGDYDFIICSTLKRAVQTLEFGKFKGIVLFTEKCREYKTTIGDFFDEEEFIPETVEEFKNRIELFKIYIKGQFSQFQNILVICHGDFIFELNNRTKYPDNGELLLIDI